MGESVKGEPRATLIRALLALALQAGLYLLAIGIFGGLLAANILLGTVGATIGPLVLANVVVGVGIVRILFFTRSRFRPPIGIEVRGVEPELIQLIDATADLVGVPPPDEVYVVAEPTAFVAQDTKFFGLWSSRLVIAVGTPLLSGLTRSELQAVLAHEFGHYAGGDTRVAGLVYRGQEAARTMAQPGGDGVIASIFAAYARVVFRANRSVGRAQEVAADRFAVEKFGTEPVRNMLSKLDDVAVAHERFIGEYVAPLVQVGHRPPSVVEPFAAFLGSEPATRTPGSGCLDATQPSPAGVRHASANRNSSRSGRGLAVCARSAIARSSRRHDTARSGARDSRSRCDGVARRGNQA